MMRFGTCHEHIRVPITAQTRRFALDTEMSAPIRMVAAFEVFCSACQTLTELQEWVSNVPEPRSRKPFALVA